MRTTVWILLAILAIAGCSRKDAETRAREAEQKIKESIPDLQSKALAQKVAPDQVKQAQEALKALNEYLGEPNGQLDAVTVNSIMAFQRSHGLKDTGILDSKTQRLLQRAAAP